MMENKSYKIICHIGPRVVADLSLDGTLTIHHDHFSDEEDFDLSRFIKAFDMWNHRRSLQHLSKKGLNEKTVEQLNALQKENPGKVYVPPPMLASEPKSGS